MILSTYGAPAPPSSKNPLVIILGVCGGCALLVIIGVGAMIFMGYNATKGLMNGAFKMPQTTAAFVKAIENHNYARAESLVDPTARMTLTESKIKTIVDQTESKLGPIQQTTYTPGQPNSNTVNEKGSQYLEYVYNIPLQFQKGSATAVLKYRSQDFGAKPDLSKLKLSGEVTGFKIQSDSQ